MRPAIPARLSSCQGLRAHRPRPSNRGRAADAAPVRTSDLILAVLGVALLGALAMMAGLSVFATPS